MVERLLLRGAQILEVGEHRAAFEIVEQTGELHTDLADFAVLWKWKLWRREDAIYLSLFPLSSVDAEDAAEGWNMRENETTSSRFVFLYTTFS